jgi:hypothetical protein
VRRSFLRAPHHLGPRCLALPQLRGRAGGGDQVAGDRRSFLMPGTLLSWLVVIQSLTAIGVGLTYIYSVWTHRTVRAVKADVEVVKTALADHVNGGPSTPEPPVS